VVKGTTRTVVASYSLATVLRLAVVQQPKSSKLAARKEKGRLQNPMTGSAGRAERAAAQRRDAYCNDVIFRELPTYTPAMQGALRKGRV